MTPEQHAIVWLAGCVTEMRNAQLKAMACQDYESMREVVCMEFPVVQGSGSRKLKKISDLECDSSLVAEAVEKILESEL